MSSCLTLTFLVALSWYRPFRARSADSLFVQPGRSSAMLTEEMRYFKFLAAVRLAIRHYVAVSDIKRLANLVMESNSKSAASQATESMRAEMMSDFTALFHKVITMH